MSNQTINAENQVTPSLRSRPHHFQHLPCSGITGGVQLEQG